jgi:hypothetical protein
VTDVPSGLSITPLRKKKKSNDDIMVIRYRHFLGKNVESHNTSVKTRYVLAEIRIKHLLKQSGVILKFS